MKKFMAGLLATVLLLASFSACAEDKNPQDTSDDTSASSDSAVTTPAETEPEITDNLPEISLDGYKFRMFTRPNYDLGFFTEEETGDILKDTVYNRNQAVMDRFECEIVNISSSGNSGEDCAATIAAGDDAYDLVAAHGRNTFNMIMNNIMMDWSYLKYVDTSREWWDANCRESFTIGGKLYTMTGDIDYMNLGYSFAMYFNKELFTNNGIEFPYEAAKAGKWTWDMWEECLKDTNVDLNTDGIISGMDDQVGYVTHEWYGLVQFMYSAGLRVVTNDAEGVPQLSIWNEKTVDVFERMFSHIEKNRTCFTAGDMFKFFREGRVFMIDGTVDGIKNLREMEQDFGILPWPKYTEEEEYQACINAAASLVTVPKTVKTENLDTVSIIMEAMASEGYKEVIPVYYDIVLQNQQSRDPESAAMIDIIRGGRAFDLGYYCNLGSISSLGVELYNAFGHADTLSSYYTKAERTAKATLEKLVNTYMNLGEEQAEG